MLKKSDVKKLLVKSRRKDKLQKTVDLAKLHRQVKGSTSTSLTVYQPPKDKIYPLVLPSETKTLLDSLKKKQLRELVDPSNRLSMKSHPTIDDRRKETLKSAKTTSKN
eukprot:CFRG6199T1